MTRTRTVLAGALLSALALAGCGSSNVGVAARVGDNVIRTERFAALLDRTFEDEQFTRTVGDDREEFVRQRLAALIHDELLRIAARRTGVRVADADVQRRLDELAESAGGLDNLASTAAQQGVARADLREAVRGIVLAEAVARELASGRPVSEAELREAFEEATGGFDQARFDEVRDQVRESVLERRGAQARDELLREIAREVRITVSPRFGRWDAERLTVVPATGLSSPAGGEDGGDQPPAPLPPTPSPSPTS